jgi:hypothetical protein
LSTGKPPVGAIVIPRQLEDDGPERLENHPKVTKNPQKPTGSEEGSGPRISQNLWPIPTPDNPKAVYPRLIN